MPTRSSLMLSKTADSKLLKKSVRLRTKSSRKSTSESNMATNRKLLQRQSQSLIPQESFERAMMTATTNCSATCSHRGRPLTQVQAAGDLSVATLIWPLATTSKENSLTTNTNLPITSEISLKTLSQGHLLMETSKKWKAVIQAILRKLSTSEPLTIQISKQLSTN